MRLTFSSWEKSARANDFFGTSALSDDVLDDAELQAVGLDSVTLQELGVKADGTGSSLQLVLGAAIHKKLGLPRAATASDRKLDAELLGVLAEWTGLQSDALQPVAAALLATKGEEKKRSVSLLPCSSSTTNGSFA